MIILRYGIPRNSKSRERENNRLVFLNRFEITSKFKKKLIITLTAVIILTGVLQIWAINRLSTYGEQISQLEFAKGAILMENQLLENQIAAKNSLSQTNEVSKKLGFEKISKLEYFEDRGLALNKN